MTQTLAGQHQNVSWNWPAARSEALFNIQSKLQIGEDKAVWVPSKKECYPSGETNCGVVEVSLV
jgi:hypothetical protein